MSGNSDGPPGNVPKEEKKDLTSLLLHSQALEAAGQAPPVPEGSVLEETPIEKISEFESLEQYAESNPPPEIPSEPNEPIQETPPTEASPPLNPEPPASTDFSVSEDLPSAESEAPGESPNMEFPAPDLAGGESSPPVDSFAQAPESSVPSAEADPFAVSPPSGDSPSQDSVPTPSDDPFASVDTANANPAGDAFAVPPPDEVGQMPEAPEPLTSVAQPNEASPPLEPADPSISARETVAKPAASTPIRSTAVPPSPPPAAPPTKAPPTDSIQKIREFSEKETPAKPNVPASFPFSVLITGKLLPEDKEKLLDLVTRENMGIREIDLEPQLEAGKVLIPRISEYAAVLLVQALRGIRAEIKVGPSDKVFATQDTRETAEPSNAFTQEDPKIEFISDLDHPAEKIPITSEKEIPNSLCNLIDMVSASAALKAQAIEAESTAEYQQIVEALQREIKYKAFRKGANAIINFKIQLNRLSSPTHYRITVLGTAVDSSTKN